MHKKTQIKSIQTTKDSEGIIQITYTFLKNKTINLQPYSQELAKKEYGFDKIVHARIFIAPDEDVNENNILEVSSTERYQIYPVAKWDLHWECLLELIR